MAYGSTDVWRDKRRLHLVFCCRARDDTVGSGFVKWRGEKVCRQPSWFPLLSFFFSNSPLSPVSFAQIYIGISVMFHYVLNRDKQLRYPLNISMLSWQPGSPCIPQSYLLQGLPSWPTSSPTLKSPVQGAGLIFPM